MIGSKFITVALVAALAAASVSCNDLLFSATEQLGESTGLNGLMGSLSKNLPMNALGGLLTSAGAGGKKSEGSLVVPTKSQEKTEVKAAAAGALSGAAAAGVVAKKEEEGEGFLGVAGPAELLKLMLNPIEFCAHIAKHFKLAFEKFFPLVSKGLNFGLELAVQPLVLSFKIIEKVFVPDFCKLKFACKAASTLSFSKTFVPTLDDKVLNESKLFRALSEGIHGQDCEAIYPCNGQPKLKEEYKDKKGLLNYFGGGGLGGSSGSGGSGGSSSSGGSGGIQNGATAGGYGGPVAIGGGSGEHHHHHHGHEHQSHEHEGGHKGGELYQGAEGQHEHQHGHEGQHEHQHEGHAEPIYAASNLLKSFKRD